LQRPQRDGRRGVSADWLQDDRCAFQIHLAQLFGRQKAVLLIADQARLRMV
jgi:hypothetical protein